MAYIAKTAFEPKVTNHEFDSLANITGLFNNASAAEEACSAGTLCVRGALLDSEAISGQKNGNAFIMTAAAATTAADEPIYACNTFGVNEVEDPVTGQTFKVGANTLGLPIPAGKPGTFTRVYLDGVSTYCFGEGNLSAAVGENKFFTIANGRLTPAAAPTTAGLPYFELLYTVNFTEGTQNAFTGYVVRGRVSKAAASGN